MVSLRCRKLVKAIENGLPNSRLSNQNLTQMIKKVLQILVLTFCILPIHAQVIRPDDTVSIQTTTATYYSDAFVGRRTSSGEVFSQDKYTCAHKSIKLGTFVLVTNPKNGKQVIVKVNDRCPYGGVIDLTKKAARAIGVSSHKVQIQILPPRYKSYWEQQDELHELMQSGQFLTSTDGFAPTPEPNVKSETTKPNTTKPAEKATSAPPKPQEKATPKNTSTTPKTTSTTTSQTANTTSVPLYDLDLCSASTTAEAMKLAEKLPINYRSKVKFIAINATKTMVRLSLSMKKEDAKEVQSKLFGIFPNSQLHLIEPKH